LATRRNDLGEAAVAMVPEIGLLLEMIAAQPGCLLARMSGSGATCFGLFAAEADARAAAASISAGRPHWWTAAALLVGS
ncbi:MAG: 4-(cytidine 5'-diphospho)-2-C-methyl-D-erythritol kinase, partial [Alphaproteobacteria bacterium]|nr:4-(cytidine 5'-diphospho)-2-C-methyl-D-erythritol kinase [Alphaproteobacteria bacterium]